MKNGNVRLTVEVIKCMKKQCNFSSFDSLRVVIYFRFKGTFSLKSFKEKIFKFIDNVIILDDAMINSDEPIR